MYASRAIVITQSLIRWILVIAAYQFFDLCASAKPICRRLRELVSAMQSLC
jgi:hypothetical protein